MKTLKIKVDGKEIEISNDFDILADDGRPLFSFYLKNGGNLEVSSGGLACKHEDVMLDSSLIIAPMASNVVGISRKKYEA